jgi:hypothetical protein
LGDVLFFRWLHHRLLMYKPFGLKTLFRKEQENTF